MLVNLLVDATVIDQRCHAQWLQFRPNMTPISRLSLKKPPMRIPNMSSLSGCSQSIFGDLEPTHAAEYCWISASSTISTFVYRHVFLAFLTGHQPLNWPWSLVVLTILVQPLSTTIKFWMKSIFKLLLAMNSFVLTTIFLDNPVAPNQLLLRDALHDIALRHKILRPEVAWWLQLETCWLVVSTWKYAS